MATLSQPDRESTQPTCQNCSTSTTPLWRRDEMGSILCNACGLFLKLHGRPRPISLKTDVIKSRNRIKTIRPDVAKPRKKSQPTMPSAAGATDPNGLDLQATAAASVRRSAAQRGLNDDGTDPTMAQATASTMYQPQPLMYPSVEDQSFQHNGLLAVGGGSPGRVPSPMNGDHLPETHEQLLAANASLKTRVSELEVIQELYRSRLVQLENEDAQARQAQEAKDKMELELRAQIEGLSRSEERLCAELEESHSRENMLKRRLDELQESLDAHENGRAQKVRVIDIIAEKDEAADSAAAASTAPDSSTVLKVEDGEGEGQGQSEGQGKEGEGSE